MDLITDIFRIIIRYLPGFILLVVIVTLTLLYISDKRQARHTIKRNYPIIGRFRYWFEELGVFFRQYFFALDREEMPFNRAQRGWVYQAAKRESTLQAFGSTRNQKEGDVVFANSVIPFTDESPEDELVFGPYCANPFTTKRVFHVSGMSYGAISKPAISALVNGAKAAGIWINTGEGGASEIHATAGADVVYQIGTAKYGVRDSKGKLDLGKLKKLAENPNIKMFEVKLSQGAKPGKGGILPAEKVSAEIAEQRGIPVGVSSISPAGHEEIKSYEDVFKFIHTLRSETQKPTGFKICIGNMRDFELLMTSLLELADQAAASAEDAVAARTRIIEEYAPDFITIDSGNGGTGAAPMSLIDAAGMNIQESLPLAVNLLERLGLRDRIKLVASGKMITPVEVAWALCAGADCVVTARGFMFSLGCIQALQCHKNSCPTGITTQNPKLQQGLDPFNKAERVANYAMEMHKELETIAHSCGVGSPHRLSRRNAMIYVSNQRAVMMDEVYAGDLTHSA